MARTANPNRISKVDITDDTLTGRGGMSLFGRYLISVGILSLLGDSFGRIRKSAKGLAVCKLFQQVFCFLFDGTSRHLQYFDELSQDKGYAAVIETDPKDMASSHTVKRFFGAFGIWCLPVFRKIVVRSVSGCSSPHASHQPFDASLRSRTTSFYRPVSQYSSPRLHINCSVT